jgi:hypothetical protein
VTLAWDPCPDVAGYRLYEGVASGVYTITNAVGNATTGTVTGLVGGVTYFFAVTAVATNGAESAYSSEVSYTPPLPTRSAPAIALTSPADGACYPASTCIDLCATVDRLGCLGSLQLFLEQRLRRHVQHFRKGPV